MIGTQIGPYSIQDEIGKGGMATVFRAYQESVDRHVAIKVIHKSIMGDEAALERFRREARLIARLEHLHILPVYDFDGAHEPPYIVMRYVDSGTLRDVINRQRLPVNEIGFLLRQVASALDYAHQQGIVHRDIKPSNIMLDKQGNAIVSDFGVARLVDSSQGNITGTGGAVGTPDYMAPEQVMGSTIDGRADVYSLGAMTFLLLTGQMPFTAETPMAVMMKHVQDKPPRATSINAELPPVIDDILMTALAKEPEKRQATARLFVDELIQGLGGAILEAPPTLLREAAQFTAAGLAYTENKKSKTDSKATPSEQNKIITVLFASAADYEAIVAETNGADAARKALQSFGERLDAIVTKHEGQMVKRGEHDWLAVWGAVSVHEDSPVRAVQAGLEMQAAMRDHGGSMFNEEEEPLPLNLGINTGLALLTPADKDESISVSGLAITLAQRLAENAEGILLISPDTYHQVQGVFNIEEDTPLKIRGRKEPVQTYRVESAKPRAFRVKTYQVAGVETKMVGREAELKQIQNAYLNAFEENETQVITVMGESGLGKSRLINEFDQWFELRPETIRVFEGQATPAMTQRPYAVWRDVLSFRFEILDDDPLPLVKQKMEQGVAELLTTPDEETAHLMGFLAGFDFSDSPHIKNLLGDPAQLAARARQLTLRFFERLGKIQPSILELEDMHYADDASLDLFNELPVSHPNLPLTIIYIARPALLERRSAWGNAQSYHKRLTILPLDKRESRELAGELLQKISDPPKEIRDLLVDRAEGNPLFMEELVRLLLDDRVILVEGSQWRVEESRLAHMRVPPSLMGMLQARVDALLYSERLTLQRASVFGRSFNDTPLEAMDKADDFHIDDLPAALNGLEERGFIQRRETTSFAGSVEYVFSQAMLRDAIYYTLLERQRITYHTASADWLLESERGEEFLPLIADHYEKAGVFEKASTYWERAGDKAFRTSSYKDSINLFERVQTPTAGTLLKIAEAYYLSGDFTSATPFINKALAIVKSDDDQASALTLFGEMTSELVGDYPKAREALTEAISLARKSGNKLTLCRALYGLGDINFRTGKLEDAREALHESLSLAREIGDVTRELFALYRMGSLNLLAQTPEETIKAEGIFHEVHTRAIEAGNLERAMTALNGLGEIAKERHNLMEARDYHQQALALGRETGSMLNTTKYLSNLADDDIKLKDLDAARLKLREALSLALQLGSQPYVLLAVMYFGNLAHAYGKTERALAFWGLARRQPVWESDSQRELDMALAEWGLDPANAEAGLAKGAGLDWDKTIQELLKGE